MEFNVMKLEHDDDIYYSVFYGVWQISDMCVNRPEGI